MAAVLFALAIPTTAFAAGPALGTSFGPLALVGLLLVIGGLLFLFGPDLLRRGSSAPAKDAASGQADTHSPDAQGAGSEVQDGTPAERAEQLPVADDPPEVPAPAAKTAPAQPRKKASPRSASKPAATTAADDDRPPLGQIYGPETCTEYAGGLTDQVLARAKVFFASLSSEGEIDSTGLAERLGALPTELAGLLLTPLTRRAEAINAPAPFAIGRVKGTRRRLWLDEDGVASRLETAISREIATRAGAGSSHPSNGGGKAADRKAVAEDLASVRATGS